eukprot:CAMPEP_0117447286 /NCGR_PEP_ID=MMETSP0759-20121206/6791_1 /TAXON_ID=63605 /ORGANISM="Percolomonas cosmopolitus, Strain WS" /LENGTH=801 /DNA_ID=CAMNT_0005239605 /DNA_START=278 /DNA_END=2680 /DNA_ORIENTATION=+
MVFRQMFAKGIGTSLMESDDELGLQRSFMGGGNRFEIAESDILSEKEKQLRYDLSAGDYKLSISSLSGKFKLKIRVHNKIEDFVSIETKLSGRGKHSKYECKFQIEEDDAPVVLDVFFKDQISLFWRKSSYDFKLVRVNQPETSSSDSQLKTPATPVSPGIFTSSDSLLNLANGSEVLSPSQQRIKVKICVGDSIRFLSMSPSTTYDKLKAKLVADYGEGNIMKYEDIEGQYVTIDNQEDLQYFFQFCNKSGIPKLYLYSAHDMDVAYSTYSALSRSLGDVTPNTPIMSPPRRRSNTSGHHRTKSSGSDVSTPIRKWQKGSLLGAGNFGKVFLGMNNDDGTLMAVKELDISSSAFSPNSSQLEALAEEINVMSQLNHEHIVRYLGMERTTDKIYIFLDFIPGGSLEAVLMDFSLPENVVRLYTLQILQGLEYLHENKIIHRDIKAANVLLDDVGNVYLADFGCSKKLTTELSQELNRSLSGTPNYMSPEVIKTGSYTDKADIWSLGCTLLEMTTGKPPWYSELTRFDNVYAFFSWLSESGEWNLAKTIPENLSESCKDFIRQCLRSNVDERPTAEELLKHPFIVDTKQEIETDEIAKPHIVEETEDADDLDSDEDDDFGGLNSDYDSESDDDDITRDILMQHAVINSDNTPVSAYSQKSADSIFDSKGDLKQIGKVEEMQALDKPSSLLSLHPQNSSNSADRRKSADLTRRNSVVVTTSSDGTDNSDSTAITPADVAHRKLAMRLLKDARNKRNSMRVPTPNDSTLEIQRFLQRNALSQTARMLSSLENHNERFKRFVVKR